MKDQSGEDTSMSITEQAAEWFVRWLAGDLNYAERRDYVKWLKLSPVHIAEFLKICRLYTVFRAVGLKDSAADSLGKANVVRFGSGDDPARAVPGSGFGFGLLRTRIAGTAAVAGLMLMIGFVVKASWIDGTITTDAGEWRALTLTDGSTMRIGPRTTLRTRFGDAQRVVHLSHGELIVEVAKEHARPFSVHAGDVVVTATGTQFAVDRQSGEVVVTVAEGAVRVEPHGVHTGRSVAVRMGEQVTISGAVSAPVQLVNLERELAWSARRLVFDNETVQEAVHEFNRRNRLQLIVDPQLRAQAVRGGFDADNPESFARSLAAGMDGELVWKSPHVLSIETLSMARP